MELAEEFEVSVTTIYNWRAKHPEFLEAVKTPKGIADDRVERSLFERATGYAHNAVKIFMPAGTDKPIIVPYVEYVPPDTTAATFWLKNRKPAEWRDKTDVAVSGNLALDVTARELTDEQLAALVIPEVK
jgi:hypothetical protein